MTLSACPTWPLPPRLVVISFPAALLQRLQTHVRSETPDELAELEPGLPALLELVGSLSFIQRQLEKKKHAAVLQMSIGSTWSGRMQRSRNLEKWLCSRTVLNYSSLSPCPPTVTF